MLPFNFLWKALLLWILNAVGVWGKYSQNQCDWKASGENEDPALGMVHQVYLRCTKGQVQWRHPQSAIRITFQFLDKNVDFRLCIRPTSDSMGANIYRDIPYGDILPVVLQRRPDLEYMNKVPNSELREIVTEMLQRTRPREIQCFESLEGKAVLLLEAQNNPLHLNLVTTFDYVLEPLTHNLLDLYHSYNDCRKCNATELVREFCSSDFVIKARLMSVTPDVTTSQNYIDILASHIYRQRDSIFNPARNNHYRGSIVRPLQCFTMRDHANYLITGGIALGEAKAGCMVRFQQAKRWFVEMTLAGLNDCDLKDVLEYSKRRRRWMTLIRVHSYPI